MAHKIDTCRSCPAKIVWCKTINGKLMPVDAEPTVDGNLVLIDDDEVFGDLPPVAVNKTDPGDQSVPGYTSHFATCAHAGKWRR